MSTRNLTTENRDGDGRFRRPELRLRYVPSESLTGLDREEDGRGNPVWNVGEVASSGCLAISEVERSREKGPGKRKGREGTKTPYL